MSAHTLSLAEASRRIAAKTLSPSELLADCLARIAAVEPRLNACIRVMADDARATAKKRDDEAPRSPLHGIPIGVKDIIDISGLPTTCHSAQRLDHVAEADAAVITRLRDAGAVFPAKLATHEFAIGGPAFDLPFPPARNPWNRDHHPGGSSSGSGAAVAARYLPAALGTDTGGSVRHPASHCGLVGLKATYGLVPRDGVFPLAFSLDHVGPLTRTVEDCALMLGVMADGDFTAGLHKGLRGLRIGYVRHFHETDQPADPEMARALDEAARVMAAEGAVITDITLPRLQEFGAVNRTILYAEAGAIHEHWLKNTPEKYAGVTRRRLLPSMFVSATDHVQAQRRRGEMSQAVLEAFNSVDLLLTASSMDPACRIDDTETVERTYPRQARTPFNVTGHPAVTIMSGLHSTGLPLSLQLVAPAWQEARLFQAAAGYERAAPWKDMAPNP